jgi:hypothetical protein
MAGLVGTFLKDELVEGLEKLNPFDQVVKGSADAINRTIEEGLHHVPVISELLDFKDAVFGKIGDAKNVLKNDASDAIHKIVGEDNMKKFKDMVGMEPDEPLLKENIDNRLNELGITRTEELVKLSRLSAKDRVQFAELENRYHNQLNAGDKMMANAMLDGMEDLIGKGEGTRPPVHETEEGLRKAFGRSVFKGKGSGLDPRMLTKSDLSPFDKISIREKLRSLIEREDNMMVEGVKEGDPEVDIKGRLLKLINEPGGAGSTRRLRLNTKGNLLFSSGQNSLAPAIALDQRSVAALERLIQNTSELSPEFKKVLLDDNGAIPVQRSAPTGHSFEPITRARNNKKFSFIENRLKKIRSDLNKPLDIDARRNNFMGKFKDKEKVFGERPRLDDEGLDAGSGEEIVGIQDTRELININKDLSLKTKQVQEFLNDSKAKGKNPIPDDLINEIANFVNATDNRINGIRAQLKEVNELNESIGDVEESIQEADEGLKRNIGSAIEGDENIELQPMGKDLKKFTEQKEAGEKKLKVLKKRFNDKIKTIASFEKGTETATKQFNELRNVKINHALIMLEDSGIKIPDKIIESMKRANAAERAIESGIGRAGDTQLEGAPSFESVKPGGAEGIAEVPVLREGVLRTPRGGSAAEGIEETGVGTTGVGSKVGEGAEEEGGDSFEQEEISDKEAERLDKVIDLSGITEADGKISPFDKVKEWYNKQNFPEPFTQEIYDGLKGKIGSGAKKIGRGIIAGFSVLAGVGLTLAFSKAKEWLDGSDIPDEVKTILKGAIDQFQNTTGKLTKKGINQIDKELKGLGELVLGLGSLNKSKSDILSLVNNPSTSTSENLKNRRELNEVEAAIKNNKAKLNENANKFSRDLKTAKRQAQVEEKKKEAKEKAKELKDEQTEKALNRGVVTPALDTGDPMRFVFNISNENRPDSSKFKKTIKPSFSNQVDNSQRRKSVRTVTGNENVFKKKIDGKSNKILSEGFK